MLAPEVGSRSRELPEGIGAGIGVSLRQLREELADCAEEALGFGLVCGGAAVVVAGEELAQEPRQRGMNVEPGRVQMRQLTGFLGTLQQGCDLLLARALQLRQSIVAGLAHRL